MMVHFSNHAHFFQNNPVLVVLIGEDQKAGKNADQHVIDCRGNAADTPPVQQGSEGKAENKDPAAQAKTIDSAPRESDMFPVHRGPIISQWYKALPRLQCWKKSSDISVSSNCSAPESASRWRVPAAQIPWLCFTFWRSYEKSLASCSRWATFITRF